MKKTGFTLAEVLIALGIIGVVAAITMPTFTASTANAKIGPALATAVSNFEQANAALIQDYDAKSLTGVKGEWDYFDAGKGTFSSTGDVTLFSDNERDNENYVAALSTFLKGNADGGALVTKSGPLYKVDVKSKEERAKHNGSNVGIISSSPSKRFLGQVNIDINGNAKPNKLGQDMFVFGLFADGTLRPKGGSLPWDNVDQGIWQKFCPSGEEPADDAAAEYCAGSIFENNMKVLYE